MPPRSFAGHKKKTTTSPTASDPGDESKDRRLTPKAPKAAAQGEDSRDRRQNNRSGEFGSGVVVDKAPIKWNPGVHKTVLHTPGVVGVQGSAGTGAPFKGSLSTFMVPGTSQVSRRLGFQFHYNPTTVSMSYSMDSNIVPNATSMFSQNMYAHLQTISISLLLNRQAEMVEVDPGNMQPPCTASDLAMFKKWGTLFDLDFLWGAINVDTKGFLDQGVTPHDLGYLQVSLLWLQLGRFYRMPVLLTQVGISHTKFSPDMVPILTQLDLSLTRFSGTDSSQHLLDTPGTTTP